MTRCGATNDRLLDSPSDPAVLRSATRKLRLHVLVPLTAAYTVNMLDRTNIGWAQLRMGPELGISKAAYGLAAGCFFVSYAGLQLPLNQLTARLGADRTLGVMMIVWGVVSCACSAVQGVGSLVALRFALGLAESGFYSGVVLYVSRIFPEDSIGAAMGIFGVGGAVLGGALGLTSGLILDRMHMVLGLSGWRWVFLLEGLPAPLLGAVLLCKLPHSVADAPFLTEGERGALAAALRRDGPVVSLRAGLREALGRAQTWVFVLQNFCCQVLIYMNAFFAGLVWRSQLPHVSILMLGVINSLPAVLITVPLSIALGRYADRGHNRRRFRVSWGTTALSAAIALLVGALMLRSASASVAPGTARALSWAAVLLLLPSNIAVGSGYTPFYPFHHASQPERLHPISIALVGALGNLGGFVGPSVLGGLHDGLGPACPPAATITDGDCVAHYGWGLVLLGAACLLWTGATGVAARRLCPFDPPAAPVGPAPHAPPDHESVSMREAMCEADSPRHVQADELVAPSRERDFR